MFLAMMVLGFIGNPHVGAADTNYDEKGFEFIILLIYRIWFHVKPYNLVNHI